SERRPELAAELVRLKVDLIVVDAGPSALAAKGATSTIPIVMTIVADPVGFDLVASLARPGGNVTGNASLSPELITKRLEILKDAAPKLALVGLLGLPPSKTKKTKLKDLNPPALALKQRWDEIKPQADAKSLEKAFQPVKEKRVGAIITTASRPFF